MSQGSTVSRAMAAFLQLDSPIGAFVGMASALDLGQPDPAVLGRLTPPAAALLELRLRGPRLVKSFVAIVRRYTPPRGPLLPEDVAGLAMQRALFVVPAANAKLGVAAGDEAAAVYRMAAVVTCEDCRDVVDAADWGPRIMVPRLSAMDYIGRSTRDWEEAVLRPAVAEFSGGKRRVAYSRVRAEGDTRFGCVARLFVLNAARTGDKRRLAGDLWLAARRATGKAKWHAMSTDERNSAVVSAAAAFGIAAYEGQARTTQSALYFDDEGNPRVDATTIRDLERQTERRGHAPPGPVSKSPPVSLDVASGDGGSAEGTASSEPIGQSVPDPRSAEPVDVVARDEFEDALDAAFAAQASRPTRNQARAVVQKELRRLLQRDVSLGGLAEITGIDKGNLSRELTRAREALARDPRLAPFAERAGLTTES
jgi:hypothetical protein